MQQQGNEKTVFGGQVGGDHYARMGQFQPWLVLKHWLTPEELRGAAKATAIIYLAREMQKGGMADIDKAIHTLQFYREMVGDQAPIGNRADSDIDESTVLPWVADMINEIRLSALEKGHPDARKVPKDPRCDGKCQECNSGKDNPLSDEEKIIAEARALLSVWVDKKRIQDGFYVVAFYEVARSILALSEITSVSKLIREDALPKDVVGVFSVVGENIVLIDVDHPEHRRFGEKMTRFGFVWS